MKNYYTKREANEIIRINSKRLYDPNMDHPPLSTERLPYDKFPQLRSRDTLKRYLYEISSNATKGRLAARGQRSLRDEDILWP